MANVSPTQEVLDGGEVIAELESGAQVTTGRLHMHDTRKGITMVLGEEQSNVQSTEIREILKEFDQIFYKGGRLPLVEVGVEHSIRIDPAAAPKASRPRRLSPSLELEVRKELKKLQEMGTIRKSSSPWASPIVCARRANGDIRLAIDYRDVNSASLPATVHPIPIIEDLLDRLSKAKYFSVLDAKAGYHQMPLKKEESEISAFVVPWGQYEWSDRTPFGLKGAGYSFQRMMTTILGECNYSDALCYLDDILVWGSTWKEHISRLRRVLGKIRDAGLALSPEKCKFGVTEVEYLGAVVSDGMLCISEQRVQHLRSLPRPRTVRQLRKAIGAFAYVQRWIPGMAETAKPLYSTLEKNPYKRLKWTDQMNFAFEKLKTQIANSAAMHLPDFEKTFVLVTDASDVGTGAMLANRASSGELLPIAFFHHALTTPEQRYSTTEKEMLAVVLAVKRFRMYLSSAKFDLITDHRALRWLNSLDVREERGRRGRWIDFLQQFDMNPIHKSGKDPVMSMADYLSRVGGDGAVVASIRAAVKGSQPNLLSTLLDLDSIEEEQHIDEEIQEVMQNIADGASAGMQSQKNQLLKFMPRLRISSNGLLCYVRCRGRKSQSQPHGIKEELIPVIPGSLRLQALHLVHDSPLSGHMGRDRTWQRARDNFWWPSMKDDVTAHITQCEVCGINKRTKKPGRAPLQYTEIPEWANDQVQIDFVGPFPRSGQHSCRYVLHIQDVLTRYVVMVPTASCTAEEAADILTDRWICVFGVPGMISSDQGSHFTSEVFRATCRLMGLQQKFGSPYHPRSQSQVERQNQLMDNVRCLCDNNVDLWPKMISRVQFSHNTSPNSTTGVAPHDLLFGMPARRPESLIKERSRSESDPDYHPTGLDNREVAEEVVRKKLQHIERALEDSRRKIAIAQKKRNKKHQCRGEPFQVGDNVRLKLSAAERHVKGGRKLAPYLSRRYVVVKVLRGGWSYLVTPSDDLSGRARVRHYDELEKAPFQRYSWEPISTDTLIPGDEGKKEDMVKDVRRSGRNRRPPQRLQVNPRNIRYESEEELHWDSSESEEDEEYSSVSEYENEME